MEEGVNFCEGQKKLIQASRALVKKPKILVVDEAMAAMDWEIEFCYS